MKSGYVKLAAVGLLNMVYKEYNMPFKLSAISSTVDSNKITLLSNGLQKMLFYIDHRFIYSIIEKYLFCTLHPQECLISYNV